MKTPITLGAYRLRNGDIVDITRVGELVAIGFAHETGERMAWDKENGMFSANPSPWDLVERIDTDLPTTINSAVKTAEDRVRAWKAHHAAAQKLADDALFILDEAKRELERLEKECEVGSHDHPVV